MSPIRGWVKRRRSSKKEKESLGTGTESTTLRESISPVVDLGSLAFAVTFEDGYGVNAGEREIPSSMDNAVTGAEEGYPFPSVRTALEKKHSYSMDRMNGDRNERVIQDVRVFV